MFYYFLDLVDMSTVYRADATGRFWKLDRYLKYWRPSAAPMAVAPYCYTSPV